MYKIQDTSSTTDMILKPIPNKLRVKTFGKTKVFIKLRRILEIQCICRQFVPDITDPIIEQISSSTLALVQLIV